MRTIDEIVMAMRGIVDGAPNRALTDDEVRSYEAMEGELRTAQQTEQVRARQTAYETPATGPLTAAPWAPGGPAEFTQRGLFNGPGPLMPDAPGTVELYEAVRGKKAARVQVPHFTNAAIGTAGTGRPTTYLGGGGPPMPLRITDLVGIPVDTQGDWGATTAFPVFGAGTAGLTAEGAAKSEYAAITPGSVVPSTIAAWTDVTDQSYSLSSFVTKLQNKLARMIALRENQLLRDTVNATAGIGAQSFVAGDQSVQILRAAATIGANVGVNPDLMIFNPADTAAIFGTAISNAFPSEILKLSMQMFGMAALAMNAQTAGFAMVGAWGACSRLALALPLTYVTDPYTQMKNNITTVLAEEAVGLAVEEPLGFTNVDIVTP